MFKRIMKLGMLASALMLSVASFAQTEQIEVEEETTYVSNDLWSDWSIGLNGGLTVPATEESPYISGYSYGATLYFSKAIDHVWSIRFQGSMHQVCNGIGKSLAMTAGGVFSIMDAIKGFGRNEKWGINVMASLGLGIDKSGILVDNFGHVYGMTNIGLGGSWKFSDNLKANLEANLYAPLGFGENVSGFKAPYSYISLGVEYKF